MGKWSFLRNSNYRRTVKSICSSKRFDFLCTLSLWEHQLYTSFYKHTCKSFSGLGILKSFLTWSQFLKSWVALFTSQGCSLRKIEGSPVLWNCKIQGAQHVICMKNLRFSSRPRAKVRRQGPPGSARAQPWPDKSLSSGWVLGKPIMLYTV